MARIRQKLERFQQFLQRNSELLSVPQRVHRRLWIRHGTDKSSLFLCKNHWNRSSFCRIRAIFSLLCKRPLSLRRQYAFAGTHNQESIQGVFTTRAIFSQVLFHMNCSNRPLGNN